MSICPEDRECTENCRSVSHANTICSAITKRCVSESDLCAYFSYLCCCPESVRDACGRTALHVAASCGKTEIINWLCRSRHLNINAKDSESNYTALHRSVFYGKINATVCLMKLGANVSLTDSDGLTIFEHALKDRTRYVTGTKGEVYVWGSNTNYTLGPQQARSVPEIMDIFHKQNPNLDVKQVCLSKFHCVIVAEDGRVFSCGHGQGGRLGLNTKHAVLTPQVVEFEANGHPNPVECVQASIAQDHSVFLTESGHIWTCGLNDHRVLGLVPPPPQVLNPRPLSLLNHPIQGICAVKYHTVAWGPKAIYSWGLHGGQLGHDRNGQKYVVVPKLAPISIGDDVKIVAVAASIGATAFATSKGDVYVLHEYQCRKIASRQLNITSLSIVGGKLDTTLDNSLSSDCIRLEVCILTNVGNLLLWQESDPQLCRCIFSLNRTIHVLQVTLTTNEMLFVTRDGEAFRGTVKERKKRGAEVAGGAQKSAFHKFLEKDDCRMVKIGKIPRIHRAVSIESDLKGRNFAVIQTNPRCGLQNKPNISPSTFQKDVFRFFEETDEFDNIHDIIFKVKHKIYNAHRYVLSFNCEKLLSLKSLDGKIFEINDVVPEIFEQMLYFAYTGTCKLLIPGKCPDFIRESCELWIKNSEGKDEATKAKDPVRMLQESAKKYGISKLQMLLDTYVYFDGFITNKKTRTMSSSVAPFNRMLYPKFYDVRIKTKNGQEIMAHKFVLAARMEYFASMFSVRWTENTSVQEISLPYPLPVVQYLLDYLYTDQVSAISTDDLEHIYSLLIIADEFLIPRLKEHCEHNLSTAITLKNVTQILAFANMYNAKQLGRCCTEFICLNLAAMLESRALEDLDESVLNDLAEYYCLWNPVMQQRVITPFSTAPSDEIVTEIARLYPISSSDSDKENKTILKSSKRKSRTHKNSFHSKTTETEAETPKKDEKSLDENRLQFEEEQSPNQSILNASNLPSRLQAINAALKQVRSEPIATEFVRLSSSLTSESDFPELGSPPFGVCAKSPKADRSDFRGKVPKLSQKQRKRLSSESGAKDVAAQVVEAPKNPWKICADPVSPVGSLNNSHNISAIITAEKKQKENFSKMLSKPLVYTQKEDKAIEDLYKFYNAENVFDEVITIERVQIALASPVWVQKSK